MAGDLEVPTLAALSMRLVRSTRLLALAGGIIASTLAGGCTRPSAQPPRSVIFILVDTLRADHLGLYGYPRPTSPHLDRLASESVWFTNNRSQSSCTFPSVNSILTSRFPSAFLGQPNGALGIPESIPTLASILGGRGYRTVAISASAIVRKTPSRFNPAGGFDRGFDRFREECVWKGASCVTREAREELAASTRPLFLYLHYIDPHGHYAPPQPFRQRFAGARSKKEFIRAGDPNPIGEWLYAGGANPHLEPQDIEQLVNLYDGEIAAFDDQLGSLLATLASGGWLEHSVLVLAADHGEEFLEHGQIKHCHTLFDTEIHTPLLIRAPGMAPRAVTLPVENLDIVPTLLDLLAVPSSKLALAGRSLRPLLEGRSLAERPQISLQGAWRAIATSRFKVIRDLATGRSALYDLAADPREAADVFERERRAGFELEQLLSSALARLEGASVDEGVRRANEAELRLRSLGYLE